MPIIIDEKQIKRLERMKRRKRKASAVKPSPKEAMDLRRRMGELWRRVLQPTADKLKNMVKEGASASELMEVVELALERAEFEYGIMSEDIINRWKIRVDAQSRRALQKALSGTLGVDITALVDSPVVSDALAVGSVQMADLITSIPREYLGKVAEAVKDNFTGQGQPEGRSLMQQLQKIGSISKTRAKFIARDQTSKLTSMVNQARQSALGVEEYIWRTSKDSRVVGKPGGLYPEGNKAHGDHFHREGKRFKWSDPPKDGHPGVPINCRCYAEPVIDIDKIVANSQNI